MLTATLTDAGAPDEAGRGAVDVRGPQRHLHDETEGSR